MNSTTARRRPLSAGVFAALAAACSGCDPIPVTELVVVVDSDLTAGAEIRSIRVAAGRVGAAAPMHDRVYALEGGRFRLPGRVVLVARDEDDQRRVTVRVSAEVEGQALVQDATVAFDARRTRYLHMTLARDCLERACADGLTCRSGVCEAPDQARVTDTEPVGVGDAGGLRMDVAETTDAPQASDAADAVDTVGGDVVEWVDSPIAEGGAPSPCPADMALVPGGRFLMGSTRHATEMPVHAVRVSAFCLERTEVTVADYVRCVRAGACPLPVASGTFKDDALNWGREDRLDHPVNGVRWGHARAYCGWAGLEGGARRLPTEAEWEFAARGPEGRYFPWGERSPVPMRDLCWSADGVRHGTCAVGAFPAQTTSGFYDLAGNVKEWVEDCYAPYVGDTSAEVVDPVVGPSCDMGHVTRGGSWNNLNGANVRGSQRQLYTDTSSNTPLFGIRCARDPR